MYFFVLLTARPNTLTSEWRYINDVLMYVYSSDTNFDSKNHFY